MKRQEPEDLKAPEKLIAERIEHVDILDVLVDTENWLKSKIDVSPARYVATVFCYGCNLGHFL